MHESGVGAVGSQASKGSLEGMCDGTVVRQVGEVPWVAADSQNPADGIQALKGGTLKPRELGREVVRLWGGPEKGMPDCSQHAALGQGTNERVRLKVPPGAAPCCCWE